MTNFDFSPGYMPKLLRLIILVAGILAGLFLALFAGLILFLSVTEFSPGQEIKPAVRGTGKSLDDPERVFTLLTWNTGYAGLGRETDFFYDGGKMVRPGKEQSGRYLEGIRRLISSLDSVDFFLLQEVDVHSKRSWYRNEYEEISASLPGFAGMLALNYNCTYVPVPLKDPVGKVVSGIATFQRYQPVAAGVHYFNTRIPWPKRMVYLKRCYLLARYRVGDGKDLVIINVHNSAFDSTGELRKKELSALDSVMGAEYRRGNYVVAGGDWNINPRGFDVSGIKSGDAVTAVKPGIDPGFLPGWSFIFDPSQPTNRNVDIPYTKGVTKTTLIDFFVVSPNVEARQVKTIQTGFAFSDHQPVVMAVGLKQVNR